MPFFHHHAEGPGGPHDHAMGPMGPHHHHAEGPGGPLDHAMGPMPPHDGPGPRPKGAHNHRGFDSHAPHKPWPLGNARDHSLLTLALMLQPFLLSVAVLCAGWCLPSNMLLCSSQPHFWPQCHSL